MPPPEFEKREPGRRFGLDRDRPAASAAHDRFDRSRGADGLCRRERRVHSMIARRARRIGAASRASAARWLKERIGARSAAEASGIIIRFGEIVSRRCEPAMVTLRIQTPRTQAQCRNERAGPETNPRSCPASEIRSHSREGCQLRNKKLGGVLSLRRLAS